MKAHFYIKAREINVFMKGYEVLITPEDKINALDIHIECELKDIKFETSKGFKLETFVKLKDKAAHYWSE